MPVPVGFTSIYFDASLPGQKEDPQNVGSNKIYNLKVKDEVFD
jgi:hypothetical protein